MNKYGHRSHLVDWGFGFSLDFAGSGLATITHPLRMSKLSLTIALLYCVGCFIASALVLALVSVVVSPDKTAGGCLWRSDAEKSRNAINRHRGRGFIGGENRLPLAFSERGVLLHGVGWSAASP